MPNPYLFSRRLSKLPPTKLAKFLWSPRALALTPDRFEYWFHVGFRQTREPLVLRDLGGALWDYNRWNQRWLHYGKRREIPIPRELADLLLDASEPDCHVIGAKLLIVVAGDFREILSVGKRLLDSGEECGPIAALFLWIEALDRELASPGSYQNVDIVELRALLAQAEQAKWTFLEWEMLKSIRSRVEGLSEKVR